jgi:hypothetical protein
MRGILRSRVRSRKDIERDNNILKKRCDYLEHHDLEMFLDSLSTLLF